MEKLNTYNRVRDIEAPFIRQLFSAVYLTLLTIIVVCCIQLIFWQTEYLWYYSIALITISTCIFFVVRSYDSHREISCQFCGGKASDVTRPFILTSKYLSMEGLKEGDNFYTQRTSRSNPFAKCWVKISNHSLACHHCRLTEEKKHLRLEEVSLAELNIIRQKRR